MIGVLERQLKEEGGERGGMGYLVVRCCPPVCDACWVCDAFFKAVGAECAEHYGAGAVDAAEGPEGELHGG